MKLLSLFDGSGGFPLAGALCGIEPVAASEIEPYPIAVTKSRFPNMKHLGDISEIDGHTIEPVDIITFGSPCQDLSVAGGRAGIKHEGMGDDETTRSGLFMEAIRIIKEMREETNGKYPRYAVWENVQGAFSSNKGEDFRIVLEEFIRICEPTAEMPAPEKKWAYADIIMGDGWSIAYRLFDAQYWGVPQRRKRIYLVADLSGERAGEILFERESMQGDLDESGEKRERTSNCAEDRPGTADQEGRDPAYTLKIRGGVERDCYGKKAGKGALIQNDLSGTLGVSQDQYLFQPVGNNGDIAGTLDSSYYKGCGMRAGVEREVVVECVIASSQPNAEITDGSISPTVTATAGMGGNNTPIVFENHSQDTRYKGPCEVSQTVSQTFGSGGNNTPFVVEKTPAYTLEPGIAAREGGHCYEDVSGTLRANAGDNQMSVAYGIDALSSNSMKSSNPHSGFHESNISKCIDTTSQDPSKNQGGMAIVENKSYGLDRASFNQGANAKYDFLVSEEFQPTITARGPGAVCHPTVAIEGNGSRPSHQGDGYKETDKMYTLNTIEKHSVAYGTGNGQADNMSLSDKVGALDCMHDQKIAIIEHGDEPQYIVRRLMPVECARLQGFPDQWGEIDHKEELTGEEFAFWSDVRYTHAKVMGKNFKSLSKDGLLKWYNKLHTDSAEYKMWGNGIALPCAYFVMSRIAEQESTP